ncbi:hypothetical protein Ciccas_005532 [Cichlidogyrus casuarinus]|uniref:SRCR domain-containing protein n=1 Tax=Cichlidogyrus casuarinus TaxID=1844966 RepID=A0ABD2Q8F2_9PLAT
MNGFVVFLIINCLSCSFAAIFPHDFTSKRVTLTRQDSPFIVDQNDIEIPKDVVVRIEPGVKVLFSAQRKLSVKGTLLAIGSKTDPIVFTSSVEQRPVKDAAKVRLVEGPEPMVGRLELFLQGHWRPVCTNYNRWSQIDVNVACQELGYAEGTFAFELDYLGYKIRDPFMPALLWKQPNCTGQETSLLDCDQMELSADAKVCASQEFVEIHCRRIHPSRASFFWHGLEIHNATKREERLFDDLGGSLGNTLLNVSSSIFEHLIISHAGVSAQLEPVAALSSSPYPPVLRNVHFFDNAYDAINFTANAGSGAVVHFGPLDRPWEARSRRQVEPRAPDRRQLVDSLFSSNLMLPYTVPELAHSGIWFCRPGAISYSPIFPLFIIAELPKNSLQSGSQCQLQVSSDKVDQILTVTPLEAVTDPDATGEILIHDSLTGTILQSWLFKPVNNSREPRLTKLYQGISSPRNAVNMVFRWTKPLAQSVCARFAPCVRVVLQISTGRSISPELLVKGSTFSHNDEHGLLVTRPWTYVRVEDSVFHSNHYGSGMKILDGASDVFIQSSSFHGNANTGLNISTFGGIRTVNDSHFEANFGHGMDLWNPYDTGRPARRLPRRIDSVVHLSSFVNNALDGIRFYNSCQPMLLLVNFTKFFHNQLAGIEFSSCQRFSPQAPITNLTVGFSEFVANRQHAILVRPALSLEGKMRNNTFRNHSLDTICVDNCISHSLHEAETLLWHWLPVTYAIEHNVFKDNWSKSAIVKVCLTPTSTQQRLHVQFNTFHHNAIHNDNNTWLNARSRQAAVIALRSPGVTVSRNYFNNPQAQFDIASQLTMPDQELDCSLNFWGDLLEMSLQDWGQAHQLVRERVFDQYHRYNLAKVRHIPVLKERDLLTKFTTEYVPEYKPPFNKGTLNGSNLIGGRIHVESGKMTHLTLGQSPYKVVSDIIVPPGGVFIVDPGVTINFANGLGMLVQGELVMSTLNSAHRFVHLQLDQNERVAALNLNKTWTSNIRLRNLTYDPDNGLISGQLQLLINEWWHEVVYLADEFYATKPTIDLAVMVCAEYNLLAHEDDWLVYSAYDGERALINVDCEEADKPIKDWQISCRYEQPTEYKLGPSRRRKSLSVQCHLPSWAGVTLAISDSAARNSRLNGVYLKQTGQRDYAIPAFNPAIDISYFSGSIQNVRIESTESSGISIKFTDPLRHNLVANSHFRNIANGAAIESFSHYLSIDQCSFESLGGAGFVQHSSLSLQQLSELRSELVSTATIFDSTSQFQRFPLAQNWTLMEQETLNLQPDDVAFIQTQPSSTLEQTIYRVRLNAFNVDNTHRFYVQVLDYNTGDFSERDTIEQVRICDGTFASGVLDQPYPVDCLRIPDDLTRLPFLSSSSSVTLELRLHDLKNTSPGAAATDARERHTLAYPRLETTNKYQPVAYTRIDNCNFAKVTKSSLEFSLQNDQTDEDGEYHMRAERHVILVRNCSFDLDHETVDAVVKVDLETQFVDDWFPPEYSQRKTCAKTFNLYEFERCNFLGSAAKMHSLSQLIKVSQLEPEPLNSNNFLVFNVKNSSFRNLNFGHKSSLRGELANCRHFLNPAEAIVINLPMTDIFYDEQLRILASHKVNLLANTFVGNSNFSLAITGHWAQVEISGNSFLHNSAAIDQPLVQLSESAKLFRISQNQFEDNSCSGILLVRGSQISPEFVEFNKNARSFITNNRFLDNAVNCTHKCATLTVSGLAYATVTRNAFSNPTYEAELWACTESSNFESNFEAKENYWGQDTADGIASRIWDFWDSYQCPRVDFSNPLADLNIEMPNYVRIVRTPPSLFIDEARNVIGGVVIGRFQLHFSTRAYKIVKDIIVPKHSVLIIASGNTLQFAPGTQLIVIGQLLAIGYANLPIRMEPLYEPKLRSQSMLYVSPDLKLRLSGGSARYEGFLEVFNETMDRWDLICDDQFSRSTAQVACRQLGLATLNPVTKTSKLFDYFVYRREDFVYVKKNFWGTSYQCTGTERILEQCPVTRNFNGGQCLEKGDYLFLHCDPSVPENRPSWGGLLFAHTNLDTQDSQAEQLSNSNLQSVLQHVQIRGTGLVTNARTAAITALRTAPKINLLDVVAGYSDGIHLVNVPEFISLANSSFLENIGVAFKLLFLGEEPTNPVFYSGIKPDLDAQDETRLPNPVVIEGSLIPVPHAIPFERFKELYYTPGDASRAPLTEYPFGEISKTNLIGLVSICSAETKILVKNRLLLYFGYAQSESKQLLCAKQFKSEVFGRRLGLRFLALNLNPDPYSKNAITVYNGNSFNESFMVAQVTLTNQRFAHSWVHVSSALHDTLSLAFTGSFSANEKLGFVAEVVTLPISQASPTTDESSRKMHTVDSCTFSQNKGGSISVQSVGDFGPPVELKNLRLEANGMAIRNFTGPNIIEIELRNPRKLAVNNIFASKNMGTMCRFRLRHTINIGSDKSLLYNFTNNVIVNSRAGPLVDIEGDYSSGFRFRQNYFAHNHCGMRNMLSFRGVVMKTFEENYIFQNEAAIILDLDGSNSLSRGSIFNWNGFQNNRAINYTVRATIFAQNTANQFHNNYFYDACLCYREDVVTGRENWWGRASEASQEASELMFGSTPNNMSDYKNFMVDMTKNFARSRIHDYTDDFYLAYVDSENAYKDNATVLRGAIYCPPTWQMLELNCFKYFGAGLSYLEARRFCIDEVDAMLASSLNRVSWITELMANSQHDYATINQHTWSSRVWVHYDSPLILSGHCSAIRNGYHESYDCDKRIPFVCQKAPYGHYSGIVIEFVAIMAVILLVLLLAIMACVAGALRKSRIRRMQAKLRTPAWAYARREKALLDDNYMSTFSLAPSQSHTSLATYAEHRLSRPPFASPPQLSYGQQEDHQPHQYENEMGRVVERTAVVSSLRGVQNTLCVASTLQCTQQQEATASYFCTQTAIDRQSVLHWLN